MKVKLLKDVGVHKAGVIIDIDDTFVLQLESDGTAERYLGSNGVYVDNSGKTYTEEEFLKMDKRTNIYKEIQANLK